MTDTLTPARDITRLTDFLWTGRDPPDPLGNASNSYMAAIGVGAIVDTRIEWSDADLVAAVDPSIAYLHAGVDDAGQTMPDCWFDVVTDFTLRQIELGVAFSSTVTWEPTAAPPQRPPRSQADGTRTTRSRGFGPLSRLLKSCTPRTPRVVAPSRRCRRQ